MKDLLKTSQTYKLRLHSTNTSKRSNLGVVVDGTKHINQVLKRKEVSRSENYARHLNFSHVKSQVYLKSKKPQNRTKNHITRNVAVMASSSPTSSTHSPTPYEQEPHLQSEQQYQNQDSLATSEPSYQNASELVMSTSNGLNNNNIIGNGDRPSTATVTLSSVNNNNSQEKITDESISNAAVPSSTMPPYDETHLNNHKSQINISKDNLNQTTNQKQNSLTMKTNINDNNNTDEMLYDIPVGE